MQGKREATVGVATVKMQPVKGVIKGVVIVDGAIKVQDEGDDADEVWRRLQDAAARLNPKFFGFDGARNRFLRFFPDGFNSSDYARKERDYKTEAKAKLDATVPLETAATGSGFAKQVLSVFQTNLLHRVGLMRTRDVLQSSNADDFIRAAARFALGEGGKQALLAMERALKPHDAAKWTVVTYLPFSWRPEAHMFLKPEITTEFAARVGHRLASDYAPRHRRVRKPARSHRADRRRDSRPQTARPNRRPELRLGGGTLRKRTPTRRQRQGQGANPLTREAFLLRQCKDRKIFLQILFRKIT